MQASNTYFANVLESLDQPLLILERNLMIRFANASFYKTFEVQKAEVEGHSLRRLSAGAWEVPGLISWLTRATAGGLHATEDIEMDQIFPGIGYRVVKLSARPIPAGTSPDEKGNVLLTVTDITKTQLLHRQLERHRERLEAANEELESFSYSISHDMRAPLRHMTGYVNLLRKSAADNLDEKSVRYLSVIENSANLMGQLIDDLLTFSRTSRVAINKHLVDPNRLLSLVIEELEEDTQGRKITWKIHELPQVYADPSLLKIVLSNFVSNAIKYSANCDEAEIEIGLAEGSRKDQSVVYIKDNGIGFDMQFADKLFGLFQRLHHQDEFTGTGLGLANVKRIITRHGGEVWGEGKVGEGAIFYFSLPKS